MTQSLAMIAGVFGGVSIFLGIQLLAWPSRQLAPMAGMIAGCTLAAVPASVVRDSVIPVAVMFAVSVLWSVAALRAAARQNTTSGTPAVNRDVTVGFVDDMAAPDVTTSGPRQRRER